MDNRLGRRIVHTQSVESITEHEYHTHAWQRIEVRPGGETSTVGVKMFVYGIRYIDDIALRVRDANESGPPEERRYYLTDANYNVVMTVDDAGRGSERIFYQAYGEPECYSFGDVDGDYDVDNDDATALETIINNNGQPYNVLADLNLDGAITQGDANLHSYYLNRSGGQNVLSVDDEGNDVGYAGYLWNDERAQWHVRHRELSPKLGRWLQRDPYHYAIGVNLFDYVRSSPARRTDPAGLAPIGPSERDPGGCGGREDTDMPSNEQEWDRYLWRLKDHQRWRDRMRDWVSDAEEQWFAAMPDACEQAKCALEVLNDSYLYYTFRREFKQNTDCQHIWGHDGYPRFKLVLWLEEFIKKNCDSDRREGPPVREFPCEGCKPDSGKQHDDTWYFEPPGPLVPPDNLPSIDPRPEVPSFLIPVQPDGTMCPERNIPRDILHEWMHHIGNTFDETPTNQHQLDRYLRMLCRFKEQQNQ